MIIEIQDSGIEARIQNQIRATGSAGAEDALLHLLETQEEQDRWLMENKCAFQDKIQRGIDQLDRSEGIPEDQLDSWLTGLKAQSEAAFDLAHIWRAIRRTANLEIANRIEAVILQKIVYLSETPGGGHWRKDLTDKDLKFFSVIHT